VPVATTDWMGFKGGIGPWAEPALHGAARPQLLSDVDGIQTEKIAALEPDVISALYSGITREDYDTLSRIAPVVAAPKGTPDWGITWQQLVRTAGQVLGRGDAAAKVEADVERRSDAAARAHPAATGRPPALVGRHGSSHAFARGSPPGSRASPSPRSRRACSLRPSSSRIGTIAAAAGVLPAAGHTACTRRAGS